MRFWRALSGGLLLFLPGTPETHLLSIFPVFCAGIAFHHQIKDDVRMNNCVDLQYLPFPVTNDSGDVGWLSHTMIFDFFS